MNKDSDLNPERNPERNYGDFAHSDESLTNETTRLLSELDRAIDHSSALRNIIGRQEALLELESITGCSRKTQTLRQEITRLEQQLYAGHDDEAADSDPSLSPA
jgi:hypothetical protein